MLFLNEKYRFSFLLKNGMYYRSYITVYDVKFSKYTKVIKLILFHCYGEALFNNEFSLIIFLILFD